MSATTLKEYKDTHRIARNDPSFPMAGGSPRVSRSFKGDATPSTLLFLRLRVEAEGAEDTCGSAYT